MRILLIDGHPDPSPDRLCHALGSAYLQGAEAAGHLTRRIDVSELDVPYLRSEAEFHNDEPPPAAREAQDHIAWAEHIVIVYPLWLGALPAALKAFLEQTLRPGFALEYADGFPIGRLKGRSARVVVTMGMPAFAYRWYFGAHTLRSLERNILKLCGVGPVRQTLFGMVGVADDERRAGWLQKMRALGGRGR